MDDYIYSYFGTQMLFNTSKSQMSGWAVLRQSNHAPCLVDNFHVAGKSRGRHQSDTRSYACTGATKHSRNTQTSGDRKLMARGALRTKYQPCFGKVWAGVIEPETRLNRGLLKTLKNRHVKPRKEKYYCCSCCCCYMPIRYPAHPQTHTEQATPPRLLSCNQASTTAPIGKPHSTKKNGRPAERKAGDNPQHVAITSPKYT